MAPRDFPPLPRITVSERSPISQASHLGGEEIAEERGSPGLSHGNHHLALTAGVIGVHTTPSIRAPKDLIGLLRGQIKVKGALA